MFRTILVLYFFGSAIVLSPCPLVLSDCRHICIIYYGIFSSSVLYFNDFFFPQRVPLGLTWNELLNELLLQCTWVLSGFVQTFEIYLEVAYYVTWQPKQGMIFPPVEVT